MYTPLNQYHVVMEVEPQVLAEPRRLCKHIYVRTSQRHAGSAQRVHPLRAQHHPLAVNHQGQFPAVTISFNLPPGVSLGDAVDDQRRGKRKSGCRRASTAVSRAPRRPSRIRSRTSRS